MENKEERTAKIWEIYKGLFLNDHKRIMQSIPTNAQMQFGNLDGEKLIDFYFRDADNDMFLVYFDCAKNMVKAFEKLNK